MAVPHLHIDLLTETKRALVVLDSSPRGPSEEFLYWLRASLINRIGDVVSSGQIKYWAGVMEEDEARAVSALWEIHQALLPCSVRGFERLPEAKEIEAVRRVLEKVAPLFPVDTSRSPVVSALKKERKKSGRPGLTRKDHRTLYDARLDAAIIALGRDGGARKEEEYAREVGVTPRWLRGQPRFIDEFRRLKSARQSSLRRGYIDKDTGNIETGEDSGTEEE